MMGGRKIDYVSVPLDWGGRDAGKMFKITEASAARAEKWAWRLILATKGTSGQIPDNLAGLGIVAVYIRGINAFLASDIDWRQLEPLLDEMFTCVEIVRDPSARDTATNQPVATALVSEDDIEEVRTRGWLRSEVLRVHANFSFIDAVLSWLGTANSTTSPPDSPNT